MSERINDDSFFCVGGYEVSGVTKTLAGKLSSEVKEYMCFKDPTLGSSDPVTKKRLFGVETATIPLDGYLDFDTTWPATYAIFSTKATATILTFGATRTAGGPVWLFPALQGDMGFGGAVGDLVPIAGDFQSNGIIAAGKLFDYSLITATGSTASQTLGAVAAGQALYAHFHVALPPAGTSPTLAVIVQSSAIGDYTDAVTRATFASFTARGAQRLKVSGPITDTHFRFTYTIGGSSSPSFRGRAAAGIDSN